jgi:hypothetical protein
VIGKLDLGDMHVPINNESLMNTRYASIVPFFVKGDFIVPFALSSKAPFASSNLFCFVRVKGVPRLVYGNNME